MAYLDNAASTPLRPGAAGSIAAELQQVGNPASLHAAGRRARNAVEEARERIAGLLGVAPLEVVFTGGGTEGDNLAIKGLLWSAQHEDPRRRVMIISAVEHHAVLDSAEWLARTGQADLVILPVDAGGRVHPDALAEALDRHAGSVAAISVIWANNEVGTVQPIAELAALAADAGVPMHSDAVQAAGFGGLDLPRGLTAATLTGHKLGGPVGIGVLVAGTDARLAPLLHGGGQERDLRSGTVNAAGAVGLATALEEAAADTDAPARIEGLRQALVDGVLAEVPEAVLNADPDHRLPSIANFSFPGCEGDALLMLLDAAGVYCSTGSACTSGVPEPSHVLRAMGVPEDLARGSLRFSLGWNSTDDDVDALLQALPAAVARAQRAGLLGQRSRA